MLKKVITNTEELNAVARHLRQIMEFDKLRSIAIEWLIPKQDVEDYISGKRYFLADAKIEEKEYSKAEDKIREEMWLLKDKQFTDIIGWHLIKECEKREELKSHILQKHKTLQKCLNSVMRKAQEVATGDYKEQHDGAEPQEPIGLAISGDQVFQWAKEYYALDDLQAEKTKKEKAIKKMQEEQVAEEKRRVPVEARTKKTVSIKKTIAEEKKQPQEEQLSLFNLIATQQGKGE